MALSLGCLRNAGGNRRCLHQLTMPRITAFRVPSGLLLNLECEKQLEGVACLR
jgi:hypothetical protein